MGAVLSLSDMVTMRHMWSVTSSGMPSQTTALVTSIFLVNQYQLSCAIMFSHQDMLSSRNYHYTTDSSLVALVFTQIRLRVVPMAQEYRLR